MMKTKFYISSLCESLDFSTVLEVGSGYGDLTNQLLTDHAIAKYISCDHDLEACEFIQNNYYGKHNQLTTFPCKFESFMLGDTKFDLVLASNMLEQLEFNKKGNPFEILDKMCETSNKYVIHTYVAKDVEKYTNYWTARQNDWSITKHRIDEERNILLAEKI